MVVVATGEEMTTTLLTVLSFIIIAAAGIGVTGRLREKRSTQQGQATISPSETSAPTLVQSAPVESVQSAPTDNADSVNTPEPLTPEVAQIPTPATEAKSESPASIDWQTSSANFIPDPWLDEPEPAAPEIQLVELIPSSEPLKPVATPELSERILQLGRARQLRQAANLTRYATHRDAQVRAATATALGMIATNKQGIEVEAIVRVLGKLSQDAKPQVRLQAIEALANIRTSSVFPWLQGALRQSDSQVRKAATIAIQRFKTGYQVKPQPVKSKPRQGKK